MYYLIEKATTTQGTAKAITDKSDLTSATMALHQVMASAMANPDVESPCHDHRRYRSCPAARILGAEQ